MDRIDQDQFFFSKGVTMACLNIAGKQPSVNDKFASLEISSEKTPEHDLMRDVGMKSNRQDLPKMPDKSFLTSSGVTGERFSSCGPEYVCSGN